MKGFLLLRSLFLSLSLVWMAGMMASPILAEAIPLKCGVVLPLTGPMSSLGASIMNSMILAHEDAHGADSVDFIFEDDQFTPRNTVALVTKLINIDQVACLVVFGSTTSLSIADLVERRGVPTISIAISEKVSAGKQYIMRHYIRVSTQAEGLAREVEKRRYPSVAILSTEQDAALALREAFLSRWGKVPVLDERLVPGMLDCRGTALKVKGAAPSAVMLNLLPPQTAICSRQLREMGYKGEFFSGPFAGNQSEITASQGALDGAWFIRNDDSLAGEYYVKYQSRFSAAPEIEGSNGYDVAKLIIAGAKSKNLNEYLHTVTGFKGILGTYSAANNTFDIPVGLRTVVKGKVGARG